MASALSSTELPAAAAELAREMAAMPDAAAAVRWLERWQASPRTGPE